MWLTKLKFSPRPEGSVKGKYFQLALSVQTVKM